jgi:hypothetical protein
MSTDQQSSILISLLHHLVSAYPTQSTFREQLRSLPHTVFCAGEARTWIIDLASALRFRNYYRLQELTQPQAYAHFVLERASLASLPRGVTLPSLARRALDELIAQIMKKARQTAWVVMRSAYPLFACQAGSETRIWLERSLFLHTDRQFLPNDDLDNWLEAKSRAGEIDHKEGVEGRWVVRKKP